MLHILERDDQVVFVGNPTPPRAWPFHALLSVPREAEECRAAGRWYVHLGKLHRDSDWYRLLISFLIVWGTYVLG